MFSQRKNEVNPDDDCDIFSTSGSTGPPKLVVHTHSSGINGCNTFLSYIEEDKPHRRYLGRNSTHVSGEISLVMPPLVVGITAVLASPTYTIQSTLETIQNERCTDTLFLIKGLYDFVNFKEVDKYDLRSLTVCSTGGSSIPVDMMENFERKANCQVIMSYGSTEGMLLTSSTQWDSPTIRHSPGKPFPNVEIKVVNDDGICVPLGNVGEIWCRSPGMFKEYLGDEKRTKDTLTPRAWFKTGDLGVFDEYGILAIVGRQTEIINKGGAKVFPAPMENILSQHPSINQVQVIGVSDKRLGMEICICIRPQNDITIDGEHIFAYLNGKVRDVNLPGYVLIVDHFTTTDVGKIDRKALTKQMEYRIKNEYILKVKGNLN
ncbi:medium-chain acyl-CoA ligase ACSF2, mitochondrial-like [Antedon mediterranea]|uniref:medium-chain acyl-CoA ligase ACSF2, mitochondrial-like n=1 Tax=Antedon mediterranea TaxID=105859 RepID=UPI003AF4DC09